MAATPAATEEPPKKELVVLDMTGPAVKAAEKAKKAAEIPAQLQSTPVAKTRVQSTVANPVKLVWEVAEK